MRESITITEVLENIARLDISICYGKEYLENTVVSSRIQRPGLALAGHFAHIRKNRIELFGETEMNFLATLAPARQKEVLMRIASINRCAFFISKKLEVPQALLVAAEHFKIPIIHTNQTTVQTNNELAYFLDFVLAPSIVIHGVCMDVSGIGIILTGRSGIGKSECALELVKRGHRFVADDAITIKRRHHYITGSASGILKDHIEVRGVGIINIPCFFGLPAVLPRKKIEMIINFMDHDKWLKRDDADRLGLTKNSREILGVNVPELICPVSPGRNMAEIVEIAAKNHMITLMGYDSTKAFADNLLTQMKKNAEIDDE